MPTKKPENLLPLAVGDRLRDCDPRVTLRDATITRVFDHCVWATRQSGRTVRIGRHRIHESPTKKSGFYKVSRG